MLWSESETATWSYNLQKITTSEAVHSIRRDGQLITACYYYFVVNNVGEVKMTIITIASYSAVNLFIMSAMRPKAYISLNEQTYEMQPEHYNERVAWSKQGQNHWLMAVRFILAISCMAIAGGLVTNPTSGEDKECRGCNSRRRPLVNVRPISSAKTIPRNSSSRYMLCKRMPTYKWSNFVTKKVNRR